MYNQVVFVLLSLVSSISCTYTKISFQKLPSSILQIINCKVYSNAIFITKGDSLIYHWVSYQKLYNYPIAYSPNGPISISCSKYGSRMDNSYIAALDQWGQVSILQQVTKTFSIQLVNIGEIKARGGETISQISLGDRYLALAYPNMKTVDIHTIRNQNPSYDYVSISINAEILAICMDFYGNLAVLITNNSSLLFRYYINPRISGTGNYLQTPVDMQQNEFKLDYQQYIESITAIRYLISSKFGSGQIIYQSNILQPFKLLQSQVHGYEQLCDGQRTFTKDLLNIQKQSDGVIATVDQYITSFVCSTDTGGYIYGQLYIASQTNNQFYLDAYYSTNQVINIVVAAVFFCCCCCCRILARAGNIAQACKPIAFIILGIYQLLCWCPTPGNIDQVQQSLQN